MEDNYSKHYSDSSFWDKIGKYAKQIGRKTLHSALILYYVGVDNKTPSWAKGVILASLGYLIFPFDAIPDLTPFAGYADDAGAIASALAAIAGSITIEHKNKADHKIGEWFENTPV